MLSYQRLQKSIIQIKIGYSQLKYLLSSRLSRTVFSSSLLVQLEYFYRLLFLQIKTLKHIIQISLDVYYVKILDDIPIKYIILYLYNVFPLQTLLNNYYSFEHNIPNYFCNNPVLDVRFRLLNNIHQNSLKLDECNFLQL